MAMTMTPSENCYAMTKTEEGKSLVAYPDPATGGAPWTIGYGHTGGVRPGDTCTEAQADEWLRQDMAHVAFHINRLLKVKVTQREFDALCVLAFNIGIGNLESSTLLKLLNEAKYEDAAMQFTRWDHAGGKEIPGLLRRRKDEQALFQAGINDTA